MVEVLDLVLGVDDLAGADTAADGGVADEELWIFRSLGHGERRQLPPALNRTWHLVLAHQLAAPLDQERRRLPIQDVQRLDSPAFGDPVMGGWN